MNLPKPNSSSSFILRDFSLYVRRLYIGLGELPYFNRIDWEGLTPLCKYESNPRLFARDLNNDGDDDLLCQRPQSR